MKIQKRLSALLLTLMLCFAMCITAGAHEIPDNAEKGSISITMNYEGKAVPGGTLTLYRVGAVNEDDGNYSFALTGDFINCGKSLKNPGDPELAADLGKYVSDNKLTGSRIEVGQNGTAVFSGLDLGLYLIVQDEAADGYEAVTPFLVSVPANENGVYIYDVDATPKVSVLRRTEPTPNTPVVPSTPTLPQTGQLNWPIPVLAILGLFLFLTGWVLRSGKKRNVYEA